MRVIPALIAAAFAPSGLGFCTQPDQAVANVLVARACEAAQTAYERVATRVFRDFPNLNLPYLWSYRLLQSELQKYDKPAKTLQALKAHLERMHFLNRIASRLAAGGKIGQGYESVEYYLAQAEFLAVQDDRQQRQAAGDKLIQACQHRYEAAWKQVMDYAELNGTIAPFLSSASDVSQDWATAAIEIARDKRGRLEAAKMYLQRAEQIEKVTLRSFPEKPPLQPVWEAAFFCADAELLVNRNQAGTDSTKRDRSLREARRNAASGVYEFVWKNVLEAHGSFERLYQWSTRLRCASLDLVANNAERLNAVAAPGQGWRISRSGFIPRTGIGA